MWLCAHRVCTSSLEPNLLSVQHLFGVTQTHRNHLVRSQTSIVYVEEYEYSTVAWMEYDAMVMDFL